MAYVYDKKHIIILIILSIKLHSSLCLESSNDFQCNELNCPFAKGQCINNQCYCFPGYITNNSNNNTNLREGRLNEEVIVQCNYEAKSHTIAFFLEFFFPFGVGHFYSQRYVQGCFKLLLFCLLCLFWCGDICGIRIRFALNSQMDKVHIFLVLLNLLTLLIVHIIDLVCFGFQIYKDGNGVDMV